MEGVCWQRGILVLEDRGFGLMAYSRWLRFVGMDWHAGRDIGGVSSALEEPLLISNDQTFVSLRLSKGGKD